MDRPRIGNYLVLTALLGLPAEAAARAAGPRGAAGAS
jgi:hypothetical protein